MSVAYVVCGVVLLILIGLIIASQRQNSKLQAQIDGKLTQVQQVKSQNHRIDQRNRQYALPQVTQTTITQTKDFLGPMLTWRSWAQYAHNLDTLRQKYPKIASEHVVSLSGDSIGTGISGRSTYKDFKAFLTEQPQQIITTFTHERSGPSATSDKSWLMAAQMQSGQLEVTSLAPIE
ncbi:MAG: hypothetical protein LKF36_07855 [Lactobacillus sp.]|jgi:uncharacterized membrane protein YraQ (UPF0718 family)|nr:hypothetical protein [Lactobacillus sp.]